MATDAGLLAARTTVAATATSDVAEAAREAFEQGVPLRVIAGGTWADAGRPVIAQRALDVSALRGIVEYVPGDLTLTARAGTTLAEIEETTRAHGQWLPLDPFGAPSGTLGATLATASAGPLAGSVGLPRDVALGVSFVDGRGTVVHGGGRVVKNVAGYDLVRLLVGAWGTLGILTEATVRLRGLPEADESVALSLPEPPAALATLLRAVRHGPIAPLAAELLSASLAARVGAGAAPLLLIRLAGNGESVRAQRAELAGIAPVRDADPEVWRRLRASDPPAPAITLRLSGPPSGLAALWSAASVLAERLGGDAHASLERGIVRWRLPAAAHAGALADALAGLGVGGARVFEQLPAPAWSHLAPSAATDRLERALRDAFDPRRVLNRGILGGESE